MISAVGIVGNVEGLGLEELGVKIDRTHVVTDEFCRTGVDGLYAIGDIAGAPWLAHKASHEGVMVAELIAGGHPHPVKPGKHCRLHLLPSAGGQCRADPKRRPRSWAMTSRSGGSRLSATARRLPWASPRA